MGKLICLENYLNRDHSHYGCFLIEPLEIGQGITLGNALRRTLLSDLTGFAITGVRINNLKHEFGMVEGLRDDILEILLNLKEITFQASFSEKQSPSKLKGFLNVKGPVIVTAGMFRLPKSKLKIINPDQYICTIVNPSECYMEIDIENGKGYRLTEENRNRIAEEKLSLTRPSTLTMDSLFMPIKKVNYKIKLIHDTKGNIKESLNLEILTNGSITPKRSILESLKILMNLIYPIFLTPNIFEVSSEFTKIFYEKEN